MVTVSEKVPGPSRLALAEIAIGCPPEELADVTVSHGWVFVRVNASVPGFVVRFTVWVAGEDDPATAPSDTAV
jgi:hypothetical protein